MDDGRLGIVDFGCVKRFDRRFVAPYGRLPQAFNNNDSAACLDTLRELGTIPKDATPELVEQIRKSFHKYGVWMERLFQPAVFDFGKERDFIQQGREISAGLIKIWRQLHINPDFIFLDRTRYGLLRLFERMEAKVSFRSKYEWPN
jgi:predicted unusual protein kinase regulating ubiquinone biosynthesis (AarF/ABC1/UbiB family)